MVDDGLVTRNGKSHNPILRNVTFHRDWFWVKKPVEGCEQYAIVVYNPKVMLQHKVNQATWLPKTNEQSSGCIICLLIM